MGRSGPKESVEDRELKVEFGARDLHVQRDRDVASWIQASQKVCSDQVDQCSCGPADPRHMVSSPIAVRS